MNTPTKNLARFASGFLMVSIVTVGLYMPSTAPHAKATVLGDAAIVSLLTGINISTGATAITTGTSLTVKTVLDGLAWTVAKVAIQTMTKSIVNWINGGFEGSPAFETDLNNSLRRLGDGVAQQVLKELASNEKIHSPFVEKLVTKVGAGYYLYSGRDAIASKLRYTLDQSSADDKAFLAGDFQQGGWNAWFSAFMEPANNPYGAQMIASQELASAISNKANTYTQELGWGSGFLSWKGDCIDAAPASSAGQNAGQTAEATTKLSDAKECLNHKTETPGSVIEQTLIPNLNSPLHQLELADSINEIVGALASQLVSKVIGGRGLSGVSQPTQGGGRSPLDQATDPSQYKSESLRTGFAQTLTSSRTQTEGYRNNWQKLAQAATSAKSACQNNSALLANPVQDTLDKSGVAIAKANSALSALAALNTKMDAAMKASSSNDSSFATISTEYSALLSSGALPNIDELSAATNSSQDTGTESPASLYTQLTYLASNNCQPIGL